MAGLSASHSRNRLYRGQRGNSRARLNLTARVVTFNGTFSCILVDVSQSGGKIVSAERPAVGAVVVIEGLPHELFGTVRWRTDESFGFEFDDTLPLEEVIALRHHAESERDAQAKATINFARNWAQGVR